MIGGDELVSLREKAEMYFKKRWRQFNEETVSDFGAYCVEQWLTGRHTATSFKYLGVDYLRSFTGGDGIRGSSDALSRLSRFTDDTESSGLAQHGSDSVELRRFDESSLLRDRRLSERERVVLILYYEWGFDLKEIGDLLAVSESRASQLLDQAVSVQKKRIQAADASEAERHRQRKEQAKIPRKIQDRPSLYQKANRIVAEMGQSNGEGMAEGAFEEVSESLFGTFAISTF